MHYLERGFLLMKLLHSRTCIQKTKKRGRVDNSVLSNFGIG